MKDIWSNPLMPKVAEEKKPDLEAFDAFIKQVEQYSLDDDKILSGQPNTQMPTIDVDFGVRIEADPLSLHLQDIPTGFTGGYEPQALHKMGGSSPTSVFDLYNSLAIVTEEEGIAEKMGISEGIVFEMGQKMGMSVSESFENRDAIKAALTIMKLFTPNKTAIS